MNDYDNSLLFRRLCEATTPAGSPLFASEAEMAAWWRRGVCTHLTLWTDDGRSLVILYTGRPGGPRGPDSRDALIVLDGQRLTGDIELHLRAEGWSQHGHQSDPAYAQVVLHVIASPARHGYRAMTSENRPPAVLTLTPALIALTPLTPSGWPCQRLAHPATSMLPWLERAGMLRYHHRVARYRRELELDGTDPDTHFLTALAEATGYGRTPAVSRQAWVTGDVTALDRPGTHRLQVLADLASTWGMSSPVAYWCGRLLTATTWDDLLVPLSPAPPARSLGRKRSAIVLWNVILPWLAAYGALVGNSRLVANALHLTQQAPGLPPNAITRVMAHWLQIPHLPSQASVHQGLHLVHARWCREKQCARCPLAQRLHRDV